MLSPISLKGLGSLATKLFIVGAGSKAASAAGAAAGFSGTSTHLASRAGLLFVKSTAIYTACDVAAALVTSDPLDIAMGQPAGAAVAVLAGSGILAAARRRGFNLMGSGARLHSLGQQRRPAAAAGATAAPAASGAQAPLPLRLSLPVHLTAASLSYYLSFHTLRLPELALHLKARYGPQEEVPLSGRLRPAMPPLSWLEENLRDYSTYVYDSGLENLGGEGAEYLPPSDPCALKAEALAQQLFAAARALVEEQHGKDSAVAQRLQDHFQGFNIPVHVWRPGAAFGKGSVEGYATPHGTSVCETSVNPGVLASEVAHLMCRHSNEAWQSAMGTTHCITLWSFSAAVLRCAADWHLPRLAFWPLLGASLARTILGPLWQGGRWQQQQQSELEGSASGFLGDGPGAREADGRVVEPLLGQSLACAIAGMQWHRGRKAHQGEGSAGGVLGDSEGAREADGRVVEPLLQPGQLGFYSFRSFNSMSIAIALEREQLALLITARAGYNPLLVLKQRSLPGSPFAALPAALPAALAFLAELVASEPPTMLTAVCAADVEGWAWPCQAKRAQMYAEALPQAMAIYEAHNPPVPPAP